MARLISRKQVEEVQDFIRDTSFAQGVSISGSLLVSQSFDLGSDPSEKSTITGSVELTGSLTIDGPLNFVGDQSLELTASVALESLDTQLFGGIKPEDFGAMDATIYVSSTSGDDTNDGRTQQFPVRTVKRAAELATAGDDGRFGLPTGSLFTGFRIEVSAGTYLEQNPIELPKNTTVWGAGLRVTKIVAKNENEDLFWVNSGCYLSEMTFAGLRVFPSVDNSQSGFAIAFAPEGMEGLTLGAAISNNTIGAANDADETTYYATYAVGGFTLGMQASDRDETTTGSDQESIAYGVSYAVNDDFSVGYSYHELETESATDEDQESTGISASYTMGGMTLGGAMNDVDNIAGTGTRDHEGYEFTLSFAF